MVKLNAAASAPFNLSPDSNATNLPGDSQDETPNPAVGVNRQFINETTNLSSDAQVRGELRKEPEPTAGQWMGQLAKFRINLSSAFREFTRTYVDERFGGVTSSMERPRSTPSGIDLSGPLSDNNSSQLSDGVQQLGSNSTNNSDDGSSDSHKLW